MGKQALEDFFDETTINKFLTFLISSASFLFATVSLGEADWGISQLILGDISIVMIWFGIGRSVLISVLWSVEMCLQWPWTAVFIQVLGVGARASRVRPQAATE